MRENQLNIIDNRKYVTRIIYVLRSLIDIGHLSPHNINYNIFECCCGYV